MSIELAFIVTCDRCGATATVPRSMSGGKHDGARTALAKVGWTRARDATVRDLCPRCGPGPCDRCGAPPRTEGGGPVALLRGVRQGVRAGRLRRAERPVRVMAMFECSAQFQSRLLQPGHVRKTSMGA